MNQELLFSETEENTVGKIIDKLQVKRKSLV